MSKKFGNYTIKRHDCTYNRSDIYIKINLDVETKNISIEIKIISTSLSVIIV